MAQICVVNCYSCETFQGQQVKKEKKWTCKMCGEKQSFRKIFAQGSGKECRQVVQKLNMIRGNLKRRMLEEQCLQERNDEPKGENEIDEDDNKESFGTSKKSQSKWSQFVQTISKDETATDEPDEEGLFMTERATFNKYKAYKRKKPKNDITLPENQQRKTPKFDQSKEIFPYNSSRWPSQTHMENLDQEASDVAPSRFSPRPEDIERKCSKILSPQRPTQACGSTKPSKWLKYA